MHTHCQSYCMSQTFDINMPIHDHIFHLDFVKHSLIFDFLPSALHLLTASQLHLAGLHGIGSAMSDPCLQCLCRHLRLDLSQDNMNHTSVFCHALFGSETHMPSILYWCLPLLFLLALFQCEITCNI